MYTFKSIIQDFERPLKTNLEDSIHMPQNHNNRPKRKSRRYPEHKHANNARLVQAANAVEATGVVPSEQRHVAPSMIGKDSEGRSLTYTYVPGAEGKVPKSSSHEAQYASTRVGRVQEATSPTKMVFGKISSRPEYKKRVSSGPIFDEVLRMRAEVRDKILADEGNETKQDAKGKIKAKEEDESRAEVIQEPERSKTPDFIPDMEVSGENWAEPLYELAARERRDEPAPRELDENNALSNAVEELNIFQEIGSSSHGDKADIVTPPLVNMESGAGKEADAEQAKSPAKEAETTIPVDLSKGSMISVKSCSSDDFEKVEKPGAAESEENGGRPKWYKGFRR